jgi:hypothetical protein
MTTFLVNAAQQKTYPLNGRAIDYNKLHKLFENMATVLQPGEESILGVDFTRSAASLYEAYTPNEVRTFLVHGFIYGAHLAGLYGLRASEVHYQPVVVSEKQGHTVEWYLFFERNLTLRVQRSELSAENYKTFAAKPGAVLSPDGLSVSFPRAVPFRMTHPILSGFSSKMDVKFFRELHEAHGMETKGIYGIDPHAPHQFAIWRAVRKASPT